MITISIKSKKHHLTAQALNPLSNFAPFYIFRKLRAICNAQIGQPVVAEQHLKKWSVARYYSLIVVAITAMFISGCQKGKLNDTELNSTTSASSSAQAKIGWPFPRKNPGSSPGTPPGLSPGTNYGAFIGSPDGTDDVDFQLNVADQLDITCLRER